MTEHDPAAASHARLIDTAPCPVCGLPLSAGVCRWCGTDLTGADGARLLELATSTAAGLAEQRQLLASLRARAGRRRPAPVGDPAAAPWVPRQRTAPRAPSWPGPVGAVAAEPAPAEPSPRSPRSIGALRAGAAFAQASAAARRAVRSTRRSLTPGPLLGLLAGLLAVAVAYSPAVRAREAGTAETGLGTLVLLAVLVTAGMWWSGRRQRCPSGAEGPQGAAGPDGAAVVVLVLAVPWLIRAGGLLGSDRATLPGFLAAGVTGATVALLGWGVLGRLPSAVTAGTLLAPVSPVLAAWWASTAPGAAPGTRAPLLAAGLLAGALLSTVRGVGVLPPAQRAVSRALAFAMVVAAAGSTGLALARPTVSASAATLAALLPLVVLLQSVPDRRTWSYRWWQLGAAALAPLVGGVAARLLVQLVLPVASPAVPWSRVRDALSMPSAVSWWPLAVGAAGATVLLSRWTDRYDPFRSLPEHLVDPEARAGSGRHRRRVVGVAHLSAGLAALGLVALPARQVVEVAANALPPWRHGPGLNAPGGAPLPYLLAMGLLGVLAWMLHRASRPVPWVAPALAGTAVVAVPLCPGTPLWVSLPLLALVSVGSAQLARLPGREGMRTPAQVVATCAAVLAFVAGLAVAMLSAPVSVACAAGLLTVRRGAVPRHRPWLFALAASCVAVVAGAVAALLPGPSGGRAVVVAFVAAGTAAVVAVTHRTTGVGPAPAGALLEGALGSRGALMVRGIGRTSAEERTAVVVTSGVTALVALTPALGAQPSGPVGALAAGLLLVAVVAGRSLPAEGTCGWGPRMLSAAAPPLTGTTVALAAVAPAAAAEAWAPAVLSAPSMVVLSATLAVALVATGVALAGRLSPEDPRRRPGELGLVLAAAGCAVAAVSVGGATWWGVALVLAAGSAAAAIPRDRRWLAWPTAVLLVAAGWTGLAVIGLRVVEGYALVAAAALAALALAVAPARGRRRSWLNLAARALAVAPGVVASASSGAERPLVWLTGSALAVLVLLAPHTRPARPAPCPRPAPRERAGRRAALLATAAGAASAGTVHALGEIGRHALAASPPTLGWTAVEAWSLPAALLIAVCAAAHLAVGDAASLAPRVGVQLVVLAAGPTALAAALEASSGSGTGLRPAALLLAGGALATWALRRPGHPVLTMQLAWRAVGVAALGAALGAAISGPPDAWTMPLGVVLLLAGETLADRGVRREWWALTPGLVVLLAPGVWLVLIRDGGLRPAVLVAVAAAVAVTGRVRHRVPLVVGGLIAVAVTTAQIGGPWLLLAGSRLPRWADVAVVAVVLGLGAVRGRRGSDPVDRPREAPDAG